ncbi:hypothetical protein ACP4OV_018627 [Aristida adscensionis]
MGNTCYLNAVDQNLLAADSLREKMLRPDVPVGPLYMSLRKLFLETDMSKHSEGVLSPGDLLSNIHAKIPQFAANEMHDSHDLLRCLFQELEVEESESRHATKDSSSVGLIESIFVGQLASTLSGTECSHSSVRYESFHDLSIPIPLGKSASCISIEDCLALYTEPEVLPDLWNCGQCSDLAKSGNYERKAGVKMRCGAKGSGNEIFTPATKRLLISSAPDSLTISLNRFTEVNEGHVKKYMKFDGHVQFEEILDIFPFMDSSSENGHTTYRLFGAVEHRGSKDMGHYVAYVKAGNSQYKTWFYTSDTVLQEVSLDDVLGSNAYVLFYEK